MLPARTRSHMFGLDEKLSFSKKSALQMSANLNKKKKRKVLLFQINIAFQKNAAARRGRRRRRHDLRHHVGPPGDLLRRVPAQLHPLSEDLRAAAWLLAVAVPPPRLPGSVPSHNAVPLVASSHPRHRVRNRTRLVRDRSFFFFFF